MRRDINPPGFSFEKNFPPQTPLGLKEKKPLIFKSPIWVTKKNSKKVFSIFFGLKGTREGYPIPIKLRVNFKGLKYSKPEEINLMKIL
jgi:hypothetical protein